MCGEPLFPFFVQAAHFLSCIQYYFSHFFAKLKMAAGRGEVLCLHSSGERLIGSCLQNTGEEHPTYTRH